MRLSLLLTWIFLVFLGGCASKAGLSDSIILTSPSGSSVSISRTSEAAGSSEQTNPAKAGLSKLTVTPIVLENGETSFSIINDINEATGAGQSIQQAALILWRWPMVIAGVVFMIGIAMFFIPIPLMKKVGPGVAVAGLALLVVGYTLGSQPYITLIIAIVCGTIITGAIIYFVYAINAERRATRNLVSNIEYLKDNVLDEKQRDTLFHGDKPLLKTTQGPNTQKIVTLARKELGYTK